MVIAYIHNLNTKTIKKYYQINNNLYIDEYTSNGIITYKINNLIELYNVIDLGPLKHMKNIISIMVFRVICIKILITKIK